MRLPIVALSVVTLCTTAAASDRERHPPTSAFWREVHTPGVREARALLRSGLEYLYEVAERQRRMHLSASPFRRQEELETLVYLERALSRFEQARERTPDDPEILYWIAVARTDSRPYAMAENRSSIDDEAFELLEQVRQLSPTYEQAAVASELGVIYTRRHDFAAAAREYERAIVHDLLPNATRHSNFAEMLMLSGDLEGAVRFYRRALEIAAHGPDSPEAEMLAMWGLGVAQDRLGEYLAGSETILHALEMGQSTARGPMGILHAELVFYEPANEIHYYEALGYEGLARLEANDAHLESALVSWRAYLEGQGGQHAPWDGLARRHVEQLEVRRRAPAQANRRARRSH